MKIPICEAFERLEVGMHITTNGDMDGTTHVFSGVITWIGEDSFTVERDDREGGGGENGGWKIFSNSIGWLSFGSLIRIVSKSAIKQEVEKTKNILLGKSRRRKIA